MDDGAFEIRSYDSAGFNLIPILPPDISGIHFHLDEQHYPHQFHNRNRHPEIMNHKQCHVHLSYKSYATLHIYNPLNLIFLSLISEFSYHSVQLNVACVMGFPFLGYQEN